MKTRALPLFVVFCLLFTTAFAQEEMFRVLASKGTNKVSSNSADWKTITPGKKLLKGDKISIDENGYVALAHTSGKTMELKKSGIYEIAKLSGELASQNSSVTKKYVDYIAGEMTNTGGENMAANRQKYMAVTGSVDRGDAIEAIKLIAPKESYVVNAPVVFKWRSIPKATTYQVNIKNMFDENLLTVSAKDTEATVDLSKLNLKKDQVYIWQVTLLENKEIRSEEHSLRYVSDEKSQVITKEVGELKAGLSEETAVNKLVLASYYEEKGLLIDAIENYTKAIKLQPEVDEYKIAYGQFLERNGLLKSKK